MKTLVINPLIGTHIDDAILEAFQIASKLVSWDVDAEYCKSIFHLLPEEQQSYQFIGSLSGNFDVVLQHNKSKVFFKVRCGELITDLCDAKTQYYQPNFLLARNGILAKNKYGHHAFFTNSGEYVRACSVGEFEYLCEQNLQILQLPYWHGFGSIGDFIRGDFYPKWKFLFSTEDRDDTNYKWATSCNGGDYANFDRHNYFVRINADKIEFACLTESYSSAEFHQTWDGRYQSASDCSDVTLIDVEGDWRVNEWNAEYGAEASLLQGYGQLCKLENLFQPALYTYSVEHDEFPGETFATPISFTEYLRRWRLICEATGKTPRQLVPKSRRHNGRPLSKGRRR